MKIPLRYQNTEYDCGTTSFVNALAYLFDREEIPVELLKSIYKYTLDVDDGKGGTSRKCAEMLSKKFIEYANSNSNFNIKCKILKGNDVNLDNLKNEIGNNSVAIARCYQTYEHYVLITKLDDTFAYIFDPYYLDEEYYILDDDVSIVLHDTFTYNRLVKIERLFDESKKDFSLLEKNDRQVIIIKR